MQSRELAEIYIDRALIGKPDGELCFTSDFAGAVGAISLHALGANDVSDHATLIHDPELGKLMISEFGSMRDFGAYERSDNPTFTLLSMSMYSLWGELANRLQKTGKISEPPHDVGYWGALKGLHANGALLLHTRSKIIKSDFGGSVDRYLADRSKPKYLEGSINEFDAAITLVDVAREHQLWVLPAPSIFEDSDVETKYNADFFVLDPKTDQAAAVQVKCTVSQYDIDTYASEDEGMVLIDGRLDLDNTKRVSHSSIARAGALVPYAGSVIEACLQYGQGRNNDLLKELMRSDKHFSFYIRQIMTKLGKQKNLYPKTLLNAHQRKVAIVSKKLSCAMDLSIVNNASDEAVV